MLEFMKKWNLQQKMQLVEMTAVETAVRSLDDILVPNVIDSFFNVRE